MTQVYDLSDPAKPVHIRDFGLPGQEPRPRWRRTATVSTSCTARSPPAPRATGIYFGYGTVSNGAVQIVDREKLLNGPKEPTPANLLASRRSRASTRRSTWARIPRCRCWAWRWRVREGLGPQPGPKQRDFIVVVNESTGNECREARQHGVHRRHHRRAAADRASRTSTCPRRRAASARAAGASARTRRTRTSRRCTTKRVVFMSWFNAGVRAVDIRDPYQPKEIGYYIPAITRPDRRSAASKTRREAALQERDPDQQRRSGRPRLHLHRRPRQHRHAHTGADGGGAGRCRLQVEKLQHEGTKLWGLAGRPRLASAQRLILSARSRR